ncbi:FAD-dependent monooxygenase [Nocardia sp. CDC159]|uniref:FAD-dependent monooxygenase n=1 Tax=Nocardia pulmonis TaxID=2951408 RepID=A0A9X2J344_9NOCA|nr:MULTISPECIES: FAD-dependent monooxygenase [Nocardia]MCM6778706.1 FAD-dependent monooxygenase [Nocardia pulmonis]MCM6791595.1 FAD-dependent monooxygenase [Nocardia sp. CDC159]
MDTDVIVVGAGPTGLMLAGELRLAGAEVVVLEQLSQPSRQSRGLGFTARAMETFDQRGLLAAFGALETSAMGHFGGLVFDYTELADCHFGSRGVPQSQTESVLERWANDLGADIRRGVTVRGLTDDGAAVAVTALAADREITLRARYLVGCDGGHSTIRKLGGFEFSGMPATRGMYLADVIGCDIRPRYLGERLPGGMVMSMPLGSGVDRVVLCERGAPAVDRGAPVDFAELAAAWERITGESIAHGSAAWASSFSDATRQVAEYRRGRVFLAGDAAHIHLPAGGQGLSTGVQDAANLGWKLGAVVCGRAAAELLDTYHAERHPVGRRLLENTQVQGMMYLTGDEADPLRALFTELIDHAEVRAHLAGTVSGLDIRYPVEHGSHPLAGRRIPPRPLRTATGTTTTTELLHPARWVLLDSGADVAAAVEPWRDSVTIVAVEPEDRAGLGGVRAALIRPDGYVAWATDRAHDTASLAEALRGWFGDSSVPLDRAAAR